MTTEVLHHAPYTNLDDGARAKIAVLMDRAYGPSSDDERDRPLHDPALNAESFMLRVDGRLVAYAGVVTTTVHADGLAFVASGLSSVATDPSVARRGYASRVVAAATRFIEESGVDLGVFTCAPELARLYTSSGNWVVAPDTIVIGSRDAGALSSVKLGVVVLMRLFSARAMEHAEQLRHGMIDLGLPVGQFW